MSIRISQKQFKKAVIFISLLILVALTVLPLYLMFATSFKSEGTILSTLNEIIPRDLDVSELPGCPRKRPFRKVYI